jgi:hypothetical protein
LTEERRDEPRRQDAGTNSTGVAELLLAELLPLCWAAFDGVDGTVNSDERERLSGRNVAAMRATTEQRRNSNGKDGEKDV